MDSEDSLSDSEYDYDRYVFYRSDSSCYRDYDNEIDNRPINFKYAKRCIGNYLLMNIMVPRMFGEYVDDFSHLNRKLAKTKLNIFFYYRSELFRQYSEFIKMNLPYEINIKIINLLLINLNL